MVWNRQRYLTIFSSYWQIYRPDLQRVLFEAVQKQGAKVEFGRKVIEVDVMAATCLLDDGTGVSGDLIIGADGELRAMSDITLTV